MSDSRYGPDEHNADYERGREAERSAIVAWLRSDRVLYKYQPEAQWFAHDIEHGQHLAGADE